MREFDLLKRRQLGQVMNLYKKLPELALPPKNSASWIIGITGPMGAGKSTLGKHLAKILRKKNLLTAVLAVDPSSKRDGGAFLADRQKFRDKELDCDMGFFMHSLGSRGAGSALAGALHKMINYLALTADVVIAETAGAGQSDDEIHKYVDTLVQVLPPLGDELNLEKAGQGEYAHIFAVNDREDFGNTKKFFAKASIGLCKEQAPDGWQKKVFVVNAKEGKGLEAFIEGLFGHRDFTKQKNNG